MNLKKALQTALDFEKRGREVYQKAASNTKNPLVKKIFSYLSDQELNHIYEIKEFIEWEHPDIDLKGDTMEGVQDFFKKEMKNFKKKTTLSDDDIKAYEAGLELEKTAYNYYKENSAMVDDSDVIKFFKFLMEQENAHYELISKAYEYAKNPVGFYTEEEGWVVEG